MLLKTFSGVPFFIVFYIWERLRPHSRERRISLASNFLLGSLSFIASSGLFYFWREIPSPCPELFTLHHPSAVSDFSLVSLLYLVFTFLILDGTSYCWHRLSHRVPQLWRLHRVHHSEVRMEASSAFRFHFIEVVLSLVPRFLLVSFFSLQLADLFVFETVFQISNQFQHANLKLTKNTEKLLGILFVTPAMHRHHHSINHQNQLSNFSTIFSFWDRLFKSYHPNAEDPIQPLGLQKNNPPPSIGQLLSLDF